MNVRRSSGKTHLGSKYETLFQKVRRTRGYSLVQSASCKLSPGTQIKCYIPVWVKTLNSLQNSATALSRVKMVTRQNRPLDLYIVGSVHVFRT